MRTSVGSIARSLFIGAVLCLLAACAATDTRPTAVSRAELIAGPAALSAPARDEHVLTKDEIVGLDEEMRRFVAAQVEGVVNPERRADKLLAGMKARGLFSLGYTGSTTTVRETFHERQGNCLSFTMLFVALAREADLRVGYQLVDVPPTWSADSDWLIVNDHINVLIKTVAGGRYVVDFNQTHVNENYSTHEIEDAHALALVYSNLGVDALTAGDPPLAFRYFRKAIDTDAAVPGPWLNLGVLYSRLGFPDYAEAAYLQVLAEDAGNSSALTNLTALYEKLGKTDLVETYRKKIRHYESRNPYYHYVLAAYAYRARRFDDALAALDKAIHLKSDEHLFYGLQGLIYEQLGRSDDAMHSFDRARRLAGRDARRSDYVEQVRELTIG